jgi:hypothetical protein
MNKFGAEFELLFLFDKATTGTIFPLISLSNLISIDLVITGGFFP